MTFGIRSISLQASDKPKKKNQPSQKPRLVNTKWVATIMPVSFVLSVVMSYLSNEALGSSGTFLSFVVLFYRSYQGSFNRGKFVVK